jgi:hypothetical protein
MSRVADTKFLHDTTSRHSGPNAAISPGECGGLEVPSSNLGAPTNATESTSLRDQGQRERTECRHDADSDEGDEPEPVAD